MNDTKASLIGKKEKIEVTPYIKVNLFEYINGTPKYQKIPILDALHKMYNETKYMLKTDEDKDAIKIEKNLKDLLQLVDSYDVIKKIEK